jgi:hypothetical protein
MSIMRFLNTRLLAVSLAFLLASCGGGSGSTTAADAGTSANAASPAPATQPGQTPATPSTSASAKTIGHVFVIVLENKGYTQTFGAGSQAPYLATTLVSQGALLTQYYGLGHNSNDNYLAMISGQAPNAQTQADCQYFTDWLGTTSPDANGQVTGTGCVYPAAIATIASQLDAKSLAWRGYMEDMGNDLTRDGSTTCSHPALNGKDGTQTATATDGYATRHNPFMYFHSVIDNAPACNSHVVRLDALATDLASPATTPAFSFIVPNLCNDGHDDPTCADGKTAGGLPFPELVVKADRFLRLQDVVRNSPLAKHVEGLRADLEALDHPFRKDHDLGAVGHVRVVSGVLDHPGAGLSAFQPGPGQGMVAPQPLDHGVCFALM